MNAELIAIAGDVRAQTLVLEALPKELAERSVKIEAGSPEGIADEVVRLLSSRVAAEVTALAEQVREQQAAGSAVVEVEATLDALGEGRVDTLLVHDDGAPEPTTRRPLGTVPAGRASSTPPSRPRCERTPRSSWCPTSPCSKGLSGALFRW